MLIVKLVVRLGFHKDGCQYLPDVNNVLIGKLVGHCCKVLCSLRDGQREVCWSEYHFCFLVYNQAAT